MSLFAKLQADIGIKAPASKFYDMFHKRPHHITHVSGEKIQGCELLEGDWGKVGSIVLWNYFHDGKARVAKNVIEASDEKNNLITFRMIEGDLLEHYKTFKITIQAIPNGDGSVVRWTLEYEKLHENIPDLYTLLEFCVGMSRDIDAYLMKCNYKA